MLPPKLNQRVRHVAPLIAERPRSADRHVEKLADCDRRIPAPLPAEEADRTLAAASVDRFRERQPLALRNGGAADGAARRHRRLQDGAAAAHDRGFFFAAGFRRAGFGGSSSSARTSSIAATGSTSITSASSAESKKSRSSSARLFC